LAVGTNNLLAWRSGASERRAADQDSRTDRDAHEPCSPPVSRGRLDSTEHAITHIIVQSASLPGAEDPG
jgi:hypothetical protein